MDAGHSPRTARTARTARTPRPAGPAAPARPGARPRPVPPAGRPAPPRARSGGRPAAARRPAPAPGLTGPGVVVVVGGGTTLVALVQWAFTGGPGLLFGLGFLGLAILGAARVRPADLAVAAVVPPVAFTGAVVVASVLFPSGNASGFVRGTAVDVFTVLALKAGLVWTGTILAAMVAYARHRAGRSARTRR